MAAFQTLRGLYLIGVLSFFFLFLSIVHSQNTTANPWPSLQYDACFSGHFPGNALGHTRPQNFLTFPEPGDASPGVGHFTVSTSNSNGVFIYSAEDYIDVYQLNGTTMNVTSTLPMQEHHELDNAFYLSTLQPFGGCSNRLAATVFLNFLNETDQDQTGSYLYYWCLDPNNTSEFSTAKPYNITTSPVAQVSSDGSYELIAVGALGNVILIFTPTGQIPELDLIPSDAVTIAIDPQMNVYFTGKTNLSMYSTDGESKSFDLVYTVPIPNGLCDNFMGSCFMNLDSGKGVIYLYGRTSLQLYAYQASNGSFIGNITLPDHPVNYGALSNNTNAGVIIIPLASKLQAINVTTNSFSLMWDFSSTQNIFSNVITDNLPYAYAVDQRGTFVGIHVFTGALIWQTVVQVSSSSSGAPSLSLGPGGSLVPSFDDLIWMMQPVKPVIPHYIYPYYAMNVLGSFKKTFQLDGNPQEDALFDQVNCSLQTPSGFTMPSKATSQNSIMCYITDPIDVATLDAYYSYIYTEGTPLVVTYQLAPFLGVGITGLNPSAIAAGTTGTIIVQGTGFDVCANFTGGCHCGFGYVEITNITTANVTTATYISNTQISCPTVAITNSIVFSANPLDFTLFFPSDPNLNSALPAVTINTDVTFTYFTRSIPPISAPPTTSSIATSGTTHHKKHVAAIVVPIVVVILVIIVVVAGFIYYRMRVKQQEYSPITSDRRSYTAF